LDYNNSTVVTLTQTYPQQRNFATITIDRARIHRYLSSLQLFEIAFDSYVLLLLSQAVGKIGSHNGRYDLDTIKKVFQLHIGDAPLRVYNTQHWKTHLENVELPESYSLRIINNVNGNMIQLATNRWNENRLVSTISHSFDDGKTVTTDFKLDRAYAHQVGSVYFFYSLGYRIVQGVKQLRNFIRQFIRSHVTKDLHKTNIAEIVKHFREIVTAWSSESDNSFLRRFSARLGLLDFFGKYPTYTEVSDRVFAILRERSVQREEFWCSRFEAILNDNRLQDLSKRVQVRRLAIMKSMLDRTEKILDYFLAKVDQQNIDERIANYVRKLIAGFEQAYINDTSFEVLFPVGRQLASYTETSELVYGLGSLLRNRDQAFDIIRSVLVNRFQSRSETSQNYDKALRALVKRLFKCNPSLTPEFHAVIAHTGDTIDLHGDYIYLNTACDYVLAHDFDGLQFSFRFASGKVYSVIPNLVEIKEYEFSNTGRVQLCGLVDGAVGDVRDRSGTEHGDLSRWLVRYCAAAARNQRKDIGPSIPECASDDDDEQQFCENFVQRGVRGGLDKRLLIAQAGAARTYK
ncbi:unnamed protein product, partial [Rotaria sp. Silwood2]